MDASLERISCLMVTRPSPERFEFLKRSVQCFHAQTYSNRELVVVLDEGSPELAERVKDYLAAWPTLVKVVQPQGRHTLGALRNLSREAAVSPVVCQWDDDDLSHPTRLAEQYKLLDQGAVAVGLQEVFHLFPQSRELYWTNYRNAPDHCQAGTLMYRRGMRARHPETGPESARGEDSALLHGLVAEGQVRYLAGAPYLYVYTFHGGNTYAEAHHRMLAGSLSISRGLLQKRQAMFDNLACFDLGPDPVDVVGNNGLAFQLTGRRCQPAARQGA